MRIDFLFLAVLSLLYELTFVWQIGRDLFAFEQTDAVQNLALFAFEIVVRHFGDVIHCDIRRDAYLRSCFDIFPQLSFTAQGHGLHRDYARTLAELMPHVRSAT